MDSVRARIKELSRAVAEGRLALAEIAAISPDELDAIYETAVMRLDVGRYADAARMLASLVVLYPFACEYWRAYAIALKLLGETAAAQRAQAMVRSLDPGTPEELVRELLGDHKVDEPTNPRIENKPEITAMVDLGDISPRRGAPGETTEPRIQVTPVRLGDHGTTTQSMTVRPEITVTAVPNAPMVQHEPTERIHWPIEEEPTALNIRPGVPTQPRPMKRERSVTALVDRRPRPIESGGDTARIDRRFRRRVMETGPAADDSLTAVIRRRKGLPLGEDA
ncbi:MAG: BTAD domain-containing putative transcriptional regulator [Myxococcota bacterium]